MNFFTSVFSDDPDPSDSYNAHRNESQGASERRSDSSSGGGAWELWKTLSAKSESIIETYRRDLQEFSTGLKKEIEVAHGSLESVGHVIDHFGNTVVKGTAQFISHGKDTILIDSDSDSNNIKNKRLNSKRYSRFDAQVRAIQGYVSTYTEVPEDLDEYEKWKSGFELEGKRDEMEGLLKENEAMESVYKRVVPSVVDRDTFWCRYYYRVYRFEKAEDVRARLVRRMSRDEEELSWDIEEEEDVSGDENKGKEGSSELHGTKRLNVEEMKKSAEEEKRGDLLQSEKDESVEESKVEKMGDGSKKSFSEEDNGNGSDKKVIMEREVENEKEDLEWDEIEDLSRIDEEKATRTGSHTKVDLRKRLSAAQEQEEEEEDLSWDIEDDDEHAKA